MGATVTLIIGPGGCGKTHRLQALAADHGDPCVWIRGSILEHGTALGALRPVLGPGEFSHHDAAAHLTATLAAATLVIVDDAHHLDETSVATLAALAANPDGGLGLAIAQRPTPRPALAALVDTAAAHGTVERVGPLDEPGLGALLAEATGTAVDSDHLAEIFAATGGIPAWAAPLASSTPGAVVDTAATALTGPIEQELTRAGITATAVAQVVTLAPDLPDDVLADAAAIDGDQLHRTLDELAAASLLDPATNHIHPAVHAASRALLSTARRRELHRQLAHAVVARGGEVGDAADHLLQSGATGSDAADLYRRAGDETRFRDPETALGWYEEAAIAGDLSPAAQVGLAEAELFAGRPATNRRPPADADTATRRRLVAVRAVDEARDGRPGRAADLFASLADSDGPAVSADTARLLAAILHAASMPGHHPPVDPPVDPLDPAAAMAHRLAVACVEHRSDPASSGRRFVDAAEAFERLDPTFVMPDSPHAIGALHLTAIGDHAGADLLLERARRGDAAAPGLANRHHLLQAWNQIRDGRYEAAIAILREPPTLHDTRDRLVFAALSAGIARRTGDIARLREAWGDAEPLLLGGTTDLFHLEVTGELVLAAARLRHLERCEPILATLRDLATDDAAGVWQVTHAWLHVQLAVENDDRDATARAADLVAGHAADRPHDRALTTAAAAWATILAVDDATPAVEEVEQAATTLAERNLPWEASRLAGQAAIRVGDPTLARRLLEQARQLHRSADPAEPAAVSAAGLSEREREIARHVVDGLTHREIGAQLYISPKTVEHHVASIRRKVRAGSRAEMLATLKTLGSATEGGGDGGPERAADH